MKKDKRMKGRKVGESQGKRLEGKKRKNRVQVGKENIKEIK